MTSAFSPLAPGLLSINLGALTRNYQKLKALSTAQIAGVIKANAYGCGAAAVFDALRKAGCTTFFVATPEEGTELRALCADTAIRIYILGGLYKGAENYYVQHALTPVINHGEELERWRKQAGSRHEPLDTALHFDTGLNRLGFQRAPTPEELSGLNPVLLMSHFSSSDEKDHPANDRQAAMFDEITQTYPETIPKSLCNSSGFFRNSAWHYDLIRPGYALYGGNPTPEATNPMDHVISLNVRILQIKTIRKGESAGYNETYRFEKDTLCAVVAAGYADGFLRSGSNRAKFYWNGHPCPLRGRISMDLSLVDISTSVNPPREGDVLELLGPHQGIDALAKDCNTIGYEILTSLGPRFERAYLR